MKALSLGLISSLLTLSAFAGGGQIGSADNQTNKINLVCEFDVMGEGLMQKDPTDNYKSEQYPTYIMEKKDLSLETSEYVVTGIGKSVGLDLTGYVRLQDGGGTGDKQTYIFDYSISNNSNYKFTVRNMTRYHAGLGDLGADTVDVTSKSGKSYLVQMRCMPKNSIYRADFAIEFRSK